MTATVSALPLDQSKAREHLTVPVDEFAEKLGELLADAEDKGSRAVLFAFGVEPAKHAQFIADMGATHAIRARLYAAILRRTMKEMGR